MCVPGILTRLSLVIVSLGICVLISTATPIAFGETVNGSPGTPEEIDAYELTASAGDTILVCLETTCGKCGGLSLYAPNGTCLSGLNDSIAAGAQPRIEYTVADTGVYTIHVTGLSGNETSEYRLSVLMVASDCRADFSASVTGGAAPLTVAFSDMSTGDPHFRSWDFGDGVTTDERDPVHIYANPGNYSVVLTVGNDSVDGTSTAGGWINVTVPGYALVFEPAAGTVMANEAIEYHLALDGGIFGISGFDVTVVLDDGSMGEIVGISSPSPLTAIEHDTLPGDAVRVKGSVDNASSVNRLFSVTVRGDAAGSAGLAVTNATVEGNAGCRHDPGTCTAVLSVREVRPFPDPAGGDFPDPTDPDGDGRYEDLDGDGQVGLGDLLIFCDNMRGIDRGDFGPVGFFDHDGNGWAGFNDVLLLGEMVR